jgi:hypothetical protein
MCISDGMEKVASGKGNDLFIPFRSISIKRDLNTLGEMNDDILEDGEAVS